MNLEDVQTFEVGEEITRFWRGSTWIVESTKDSHVWWRNDMFDAAQQVPMQIVYARLDKELVRIPANECKKISAPSALP